MQGGSAVKTCAVINDLSGYGKCSLGAALPILAAMRVEAHPLLTAYFTNQTGYDSFQFADLTGFMDAVCTEWQKLGASFDGILTGFVAGQKQFDAIEHFLDLFKKKQTVLLVDPVMGDGGEMYATYDRAMCDRVAQLCRRADVITPNETELRLLTGETDIEKGARRMLENGVSFVAVTGIKQNGKMLTGAFSAQDSAYFETRRVRTLGGHDSFSGTGDIFAAVLLGAMLGGTPFLDAVKQACGFVETALSVSSPTDRNDGIDFEKCLHLLWEAEKYGSKTSADQKV